MKKAHGESLVYLHTDVIMDRRSATGPGTGGGGGGTDAVSNCADLDFLTTKQTRELMRTIREHAKKRRGSVFINERLDVRASSSSQKKVVVAGAVCCKILVDDHDRRRDRKQTKAKTKKPKSDGAHDGN